MKSTYIDNVSCFALLGVYCFILGHLSLEHGYLLVYSILGNTKTLDDMVRLQKQLVKKRHCGKAEYQYPVYSVTIPKVS